MKTRTRKAGTTGTTRRRAAPKSKATPPASGNSHTVITENERRRMIAEAAYYRWIARGCAPGGELGDWLAAEREVDALLAGGPATPLRPAVEGLEPVAVHRGVIVETPPADATAR